MYSTEDIIQNSYHWTIVKSLRRCPSRVFVWKVLGNMTLSDAIWGRLDSHKCDTNLNTYTEVVCFLAWFGVISGLRFTYCISPLSFIRLAVIISISISPPTPAYTCLPRSTDSLLPLNSPGLNSHKLPSPSWPPPLHPPQQLSLDPLTCYHLNHS